MRRGGNRHRLRVSTQSWLWRIIFSYCSCWDSNSQPFNYESGTLTNKWSWLHFLIRFTLSTNNAHSEVGSLWMCVITSCATAQLCIGSTLTKETKHIFMQLLFGLYLFIYYWSIFNLICKWFESYEFFFSRTPKKLPHLPSRPSFCLSPLQSTPICLPTLLWISLFFFFLKFMIVGQFTFSCRNRWTTCPMNWLYLTTHTSSQLFILFCLLKDGCCHLRPPLWPWNMDPACWLGKGSRPSKPSA